MTKLMLVICTIIPGVLLGDMILTACVRDAYGIALSNAFVVFTLIAQLAAVIIYFMQKSFGDK